MIEVPGDQGVLGDEDHRVAEAGQDLKTAPGDHQLALDRLIGIGHTRHGEDLRKVTRRGQLLLQQIRGTFLHQDSGLEIEAGREAEILVVRPRIAIGAAVLAATIGIDAGVEGEVLRSVPGDDGLRVVPQKLGGTLPPGGLLRREVHVKGIEAVLGVEAAPPPLVPVPAH